MSFECRLFKLYPGRQPDLLADQLQAGVAWEAEEPFAGFADEVFGEAEDSSQALVRNRRAPPARRSPFALPTYARPALVSRGHPAMKPAVIAYERGFGASPTYLRSGGPIPMVSLLQQVLGMPTVLMGFALPDDRMHAPNEKFHLPNFFHATATLIWFLSEIAARLGEQPRPHARGPRAA